MEMRFHYIADGFGCDVLTKLRHHGCYGRGLRVRVDNQQIPGVLEDRGVAVGDSGPTRDGCVHAIGHFFDFKRVSGRKRRLRECEAGTEKSLFQQGRAQESGAQRLRKKTTPGVRVHRTSGVDCTAGSFAAQ
jgi:hypothetical protein